MVVQFKSWRNVESSKENYGTLLHVHFPTVLSTLSILLWGNHVVTCIHWDLQYLKRGKGGGYYRDETQSLNMILKDCCFLIVTMMVKCTKWKYMPICRIEEKVNYLKLNMWIYSYKGGIDSFMGDNLRHISRKIQMCFFWRENYWGGGEVVRQGWGGGVAWELLL